MYHSVNKTPRTFEFAKVIFTHRRNFKRRQTAFCKNGDTYISTQPIKMTGFERILWHTFNGMT